MPDPLIVVAVLMLLGSAYGFGFIHGEHHERQRWEDNMARLRRILRGSQ